MKISMGIGWPLLLLAAGSSAYGWKGFFWTLVGFVVCFFIVLPIMAVILKTKPKVKNE